MSERASDDRTWMFRSMIAITGLVAAILWLRFSVSVYRYLVLPFQTGSTAAAVAFALIVLLPLVTGYVAIEYWLEYSTNGGRGDG